MLDFLIQDLKIYLIEILWKYQPKDIPSLFLISKEWNALTKKVIHELYYSYWKDPNQISKVISHWLFQIFSFFYKSFNYSILNQLLQKEEENKKNLQYKQDFLFRLCFRSYTNPLIPHTSEFVELGYIIYNESCTRLECIYWKPTHMSYIELANLKQLEFYLKEEIDFIFKNTQKRDILLYHRPDKDFCVSSFNTIHFILVEMKKQKKISFSEKLFIKNEKDISMQDLIHWLQEENHFYPFYLQNWLPTL